MDETRWFRWNEMIWDAPKNRGILRGQELISNFGGSNLALSVVAVVVDISCSAIRVNAAFCPCCFLEVGTPIATAIGGKMHRAPQPCGLFYHLPQCEWPHMSTPSYKHLMLEGVPGQKNRRHWVICATVIQAVPQRMVILESSQWVYKSPTIA